MKVRSKWLPLIGSMKNNLGYWLGDPSGKAAFHAGSDLRWVNFQDLEVGDNVNLEEGSKILGDA